MEEDEVSKEKTSQPRAANKMAERVALSLWHREAWALRDVVIRGEKVGKVSFPATGNTTVHMLPALGTVPVVLIT